MRAKIILEMYTVKLDRILNNFTNKKQNLYL